MTKILYTLIGISWISFYIYRFSNEKTEQDFLHMSLITRYIFIVISMLWIIFSLCKLYLLFKKNYRRGYLHKLVSSVLEQIYYRPLQYIWDKYLNKIPLVPNFVCCLGFVIYFFVRDVKHIKLLLLSTLYLTRIIVVAVLFIEMIFLKKLNLFYSVILLSMLTLIFNAIIYIIKKEFEFRCKTLEDNYLTIEKNNGIDVIISLRRPIDSALFKNLVSKWNLYKNIVNICYGIEGLKVSWNLLYHLEVFLTYFTLLSWSFCFIFQIHTLIVY